MNSDIVKQIITLEKALNSCDLPFDRFTIMDALRSAYLLNDDVPNAERVSNTFIEETSSFLKYGGGTPEQKQAILDKMFDAYVTLAPNDFHSFLIALEWERESKEKFYQPRISILRDIVNDMTDMMVHDKYDMLMLSMPPGTGKLLSDDTPVLTTEGWKNHGDLRVGDCVYNHKGESVSIEHVFPKQTANVKLIFSNGEEICCHENHEWLVYDRSCGKERIVETKYLASQKLDSGTPNTRGHRYRFQLPNRIPNAGVEKSLPVKPYTFGAWLGDGTNVSPNITGVDQEIIDGIVADGYALRASWQHKTTGVTTSSFVDLRTDLQKIGLCYSRRTVEKYIPDCYLTASKSQRLELLAGLLDTDGCKASEHKYTYTTCEAKLRDSVLALISTFGWRTYVVEEQPKLSSSGIKGAKPYWVIGFCPTEYIPCRVRRKQLSSYAKQRKISIVAVEKIDAKSGNCIQVDGGIYLAGKSMLPTHNSTLGLFFLAWVAGRQPEKCNLAIGYSTPMAKSFFTRVSAIDLSLDYTYHKIFPNLTRVYTSAKELELDFSNDASDVKKPFVTLTCASVSGSLTGRTRCENLLYCDDLVEGAETAMSPTRLEKLWALYNSNARSRKKEGCKELHIGTRWSLNDPIGRLMAIYGANERCKIVSLPALDENDESNFHYEYGVGFSTQMFKDLRTTQSTIAWNALYMQRPIEAEGLLFPVDTLKRFDIEDIDLFKNPPDDVFAFVDVAFGGADYLSMPILAQWGTDPPYVLDVVFMKGSYERTQPVVLGKLAQWGVQRVVFEANNGGDFYAEDVKKMVKDYGLHCYVTSERAGTRISKEARIIQHQPAIKSFRFRKAECYPEDNHYREFMQNLITYTAQGDNEHDDAPDSCAGVAAMMRTNTRAKLKIVARRFI